MKNFKFTAKFIAVGVLLFVMLSFNWDRIELQGRAFVITIGIDASQDDGDDKFEVSMNIADVAVMEGNGGDGEATVTRLAEGETLARAMGQIDAKISDKIYYGHTKAVILGESIISDEDLLKEVVDTLTRKNEINIKAIVMATDGAAKDILGAKTQEQSPLGLYLSGFYNSNNTNTAASVVKLDLEGLADSLRHDHSAVIPKITKEDEGEEVAISGVAVVKDFELAGYIPEDAMEGFLWLVANGAGSQVAIEAQDGHITFLMAKSGTKFSFREEGGQLYCIAKFRTSGSIEGARFMKDDLYDTERMNQLQKDVAQKIHNKMEEIFRIFQEDFPVDGFGLKEIMRKKYRHLHQRYGDDWDATLENMIFVTDIDVTIRNAGSVK